jgi:putative lipoic acid-binding regulatory protein
METPRLLQFPCDYPIKVMMRAAPGIRAAADAAIARHAGEAAAARVSERASAQGNFTGVTYTIVASGEQQIAALFADLKQIDGVLLVL